MTTKKNFVTCEECGAERNKCILGRQLCTYDLLKSQEVFLKKTAKESEPSTNKIQNSSKKN